MAGLEIELLKNRKAEKGGSADEGELEMPAGEEVAQELIDAVKAGDAKAVWKAYRGLAACDSGDSEDDE